MDQNESNYGAMSIEGGVGQGHNGGGQMERSESAQERGRMLRGAAQRTTGYIDTASTSVGRGLETAATSISRRVDTASEGMARAGRYLQESNAQTMGRDLTEWVREHPTAALSVGFGLGFLLGRAFSPRS